MNQKLKFLCLVLANQRDKFSIPYIQRKYKVSRKAATMVYDESMKERGKIMKLKKAA